MLHLLSVASMRHCTAGAARPRAAGEHFPRAALLLARLYQKGLPVWSRRLQRFKTRKEGMVSSMSNISTCLTSPSFPCFHCMTETSLNIRCTKSSVLCYKKEKKKDFHPSWMIYSSRCIFFKCTVHGRNLFMSFFSV